MYKNKIIKIISNIIIAYITIDILYNEYKKHQIVLFGDDPIELINIKIICVFFLFLFLFIKTYLSYKYCPTYEEEEIILFFKYIVYQCINTIKFVIIQIKIKYINLSIKIKYILFLKYPNKKKNKILKKAAEKIKKHIFLGQLELDRNEEKNQKISREIRKTFNSMSPQEKLNLFCIFDGINSTIDKKKKINQWCLEKTPLLMKKINETQDHKKKINLIINHLIVLKKHYIWLCDMGMATPETLNIMQKRINKINLFLDYNKKKDLKIDQLFIFLVYTYTEAITISDEVNIYITSFTIQLIFNLFLKKINVSLALKGAMLTNIPEQKKFTVSCLTIIETVDDKNV